MNLRHGLLLAGLMGGVGVALYLHLKPAMASGPLAHVENAFAFRVHAPYDSVAPLFGALKEKVWAGDQWNPAFLYPQPARDIEGAVFTIDHGHGHAHATWVNTAFDLEAGRVQYVYVIPEKQAVRIDIRLARHDGPPWTDVNVIYQRTALRADFNTTLIEIGEKDRQSAPEWSSAIESYLRTLKVKGQ
jgi:hypothetical protein